MLRVDDDPDAPLLSACTYFDQIRVKFLDVDNVLFRYR